MQREAKNHASFDNSPPLSLYVCLLATASLTSFFMWGKTIGDPGFRFVWYFLVELGQPQRDMRWLHRLLHDSNQLLTQLVQVHLIAQRGTEGSYDFSSIIFATIEVAVNDVLEAPPQRLGEGRNHQG